MSAFLTALLSVLGPLLVKLLQGVLEKLIDRWKKKPETQAILAACDTPEKLHAAMPRLRALVDKDFRGPVRRAMVHRVLTKMERKPVTDAVWDHLVTTGAVQGKLTNVPHAAVLAAVRADD